MTASYHVKLHNLGRAARVIHDDARPVRIPAGEWVDAVLSEETIKRIKAEKPIEDEPRLELEQGEKAEDAPPPPPPPPPSEGHEASQPVASVEENHASHKKRAPHA